MKLILLLVICCLALHNGIGAPRTAVYKFVRCNPEGDQANCVTQQGPEMAWSPDLPVKLPASAAQYLEAVPLEEKSSPNGEYEDEEYEEWMDKEDPPVISEEGESPMVFPGEEGSGGYEGSAGEGPYMADRASSTESDTGSGESWTDTELYKVGDLSFMRRLFPSRPLVGEGIPAEEELKDEHLLQL